MVDTGSWTIAPPAHGGPRLAMVQGRAAPRHAEEWSETRASWAPRKGFAVTCIRRAARRLSPSLIAVVWVAVAPAAGQVQGIGGPASIQHGQFGQAVTSIPDVNGDGVTDVAVSANDRPHGVVILPFPEHGRVFIYSGATGVYLRSIIPATANTGFGYAIAGLRDVNGDGRGDMAISATEIAGPGSGSGRVFVYSGATGMWLRTLVPPSSGVGTRFGSAVASVGDVNGDGRGDVLVGAPLAGELTIPENSGRAVLYSGATGAIIRVIPTPVGIGDHAFGSALAGMPDINADGRPDYAIAGVEALTVYSGATGQIVYRINGFFNTFGFGQGVASVPDADGDGVADLVVGAPMSDLDLCPMCPAFAPQAGRAFLYSGRTGVLLFSRRGPALGSNRFGWSVAGLADINGDGRGEFAVAAPLNAELGAGQGYGPGAVYVYSGANGAILKVIQSPNAELGGRFGQSIVGLPDTNGNGRGDLFIGAPYEDPGGPVWDDGGRAYFVRY